MINEDYIRDMKRIKIRWPVLSFFLNCFKGLGEWICDDDYPEILGLVFLGGFGWAIFPGLIPIGALLYNNAVVWWQHGHPTILGYVTIAGFVPAAILALLGILYRILPMSVKQIPLIPHALSKLFTALIPRIEVETIPVNKEEIAKLEKELEVI